MKHAMTAALVVINVYTVALAQGSPPTPAPNVPVKMVRCRELFHKNADGSWSANSTVTIGGATVSPSVSYRPGVASGGVDLAKTCELDGSFIAK